MSWDQIVRSYDVRGLYPAEINEDQVNLLARAFAVYLPARAVVTGRDCRPSSPQLYRALLDGLLAAGVEVYDLDLATTPMLYFASGHLAVDGAMMLTASHNPPEYNGLKFTRSRAEPIGRESGLEDIKHLAEAGDFPIPERPGRTHPADILEAYRAFHAERSKFGDRKFRVVIDPGNMMGALEIDTYRRLTPGLEIHTIHDTLDGTQPNHPANPAEPDNLRDLAAAVVDREADLGIAYDGDGDRIGFVDEQGHYIRGDLLTAILAAPLLKQEPGAAVIYDANSSRVVPEEIEQHGGRAIRSKVGHVHIKHAMRQEEAALAGELSCHYYFRDHFYSESGTLAAIQLLNEMAARGQPASRLVAEVDRYAHSGVRQLPAEQPARLLKRAREAYPEGELSELDGVRVDLPDWWFIIRPSNTEPVVKLIAEAGSRELLAEKLAELAEVLEVKLDQ